MSILNDRAVRTQLALLVLLLLCLVLTAELLVARIVDGYQQTLLAHDQAVAGYQSLHGVDEQQIIQAFAGVKTAADQETGAALLAAADYTADTPQHLLSAVYASRQRYAWTVRAVLLVFALLLLGLFVRFARRRDRRLALAREDILRFMAGDTGIRLADYGEDDLSRLLAAVNTMATSLTAHAERERHNREFLKETISDISHQLRTPLAALTMYNEIILSEQPGSDVVTEFATKSLRELARMQGLIENLLKLARLDAGTITLNRQDQLIKAFLRTSLAGMETRAELEGKSLRLEGDEAIVLRFDAIWLGEAVGNVVKNALDHTQPGNWVQVSCRTTAVSNEISVQDNGSGIHPEDIHHIFKRFYRSRFATDQQGVGIGLALARSIVELHGGTITVESELGQGATFHLLFPKLADL